MGTIANERAPGAAADVDAERTLVRAAIAGDEQAARELVAVLIPTIQLRAARGLARRAGAARGRSLRQELEDLTQEVLLHLFDDDARALRAWDPARGLGLHPFVGLVTERQVATILRSGKRSPWTEDPTLDEVLAEAPELESLPETSPEVVTTRRDLHAKLLDRLRERLSATGLHLFHLTIVEERPIEEVCAETGMARGAVYTWKSRLLGTIRTLARELEGEPSSAPDRRRGGGVTP